MPFKTLTPQDWALLRAARLSALADSPDSFGGDVNEESSWSAAVWQDLAGREVWAVRVESEAVTALVNVRPAEDAADADCWIRSWWIAPGARGTGASALVLQWVDAECRARGWSRQGLGVWCDNQVARSAFARLGFQQAGAEERSAMWGGRCYVRMLRRVPDVPQPVENPDGRERGVENPDGRERGVENPDGRERGVEN